MHELAIAQQVIAVAQARVGGARVLRLTLEVGTLSAVLPDAMRFCFELACAGTNLADAKLTIVEVVGQGRCRACASDVPMPRPFARCARCESTNIEWVSGEDLRIAALEVEDV